MGTGSHILKWLCRLIIRCYQLFISPLLGSHCRFYPSCSSYMNEAITQHGVCKGGWFGFRRLLRCHPWHSGGYDPVPKNLTKR